MRFKQFVSVGFGFGAVWLASGCVATTEDDGGVEDELGVAAEALGSGWGQFRNDRGECLETDGNGLDVVRCSSGSDQWRRLDVTCPVYIDRRCYVRQSALQHRATGKCLDVDSSSLLGSCGTLSADKLFMYTSSSSVSRHYSARTAECIRSYSNGTANYTDNCNDVTQTRWQLR